MTTPLKPPAHDLSDPVTVASVLVRDHLDTVLVRHGKAQGDPVSAAVLMLVTALLEHLPGEAKQARIERDRELP
jgi:hypothetical protein